MRLAVFCGSSVGKSDEFLKAAQALGRLLAQQGIELVYGGGHVGLMGGIADAVLGAGGKVIGVMPQHLVDREIAHTGLSELIVVADMHERKLKMADLSDGFIAMPGGAGTIEEITEQWTWAQLGVHQKPCAFLNILNYYDPFKIFVASMVEQGFVAADYADMLIYSDDPQVILNEIKDYNAPAPKWTGKTPM
ncbi:MAG: TIGR00730 family Rossman fold protein [Alphaproteobacteria bacterium]|nr:TIGR00730 family Rossman fold protein [Alphaproteobacteria bacterium]